MILLKASRDLYVSFGAVIHLHEGPCGSALFMLKARAILYLHCGHMNTNSCRNGLTVYFAFQNISKK
jgi:hypothetical protein